jgi:hypothetical protein
MLSCAVLMPVLIGPGGRFWKFDGMPEGASRELMQRIMDIATAEPHQYQHCWRRGDVVLWDNRCLLHTAPPGSRAGGDRMGVGDGRLFRRLRPTSKQLPQGPAMIASMPSLGMSTTLAGGSRL